MHKRACAWVCADILRNNISNESGINCQRLAPLMLLFLPLWQLCWTVQGSTADTKKILWQLSSLLSWRWNLTASGLVNVMNFLFLLHYQLSASFSRDVTILCQAWLHTVKVKCSGVSIHYFQAFVFANATHTHTHSDTSIPRVLSLFVFRSAAVQGEVGTVRAYSICALRFLSRSPGFLFRVFIKLKSWTTHYFPLHLAENRKE